MSYGDVPARVAGVRERIGRACARVGRDPAEVTIVAVTKTHPPEAVRAVREAGLLDVGENKVQELVGKVELLGRAAARWHLIGHLQRNKARRAVALADLIHSVDSLRLAEKLSFDATEAGKVVDVLLQVNVSGEETKGGLEGPALLDDVQRICGLRGLRVLGLMTMAPQSGDERVLRDVFARTRELMERARSFDGFAGHHLSMGMSGDFEVAVEEGSTIVRLGTILLGERAE